MFIVIIITDMRFTCWLPYIHTHTHRGCSVVDVSYTKLSEGGFSNIISQVY